MCPVHIELVKPSYRIHEVRPGVFVAVVHRIDKGKGRWYRSKEYPTVIEVTAAKKRLFHDFRRRPTMWWAPSSLVFLADGWQEFNGDLSSLSSLHMQEASV